jgi:hypothetical protein
VFSHILDGQLRLTISFLGLRVSSSSALPCLTVSIFLGLYELRLRSEYRYDWNTDNVKFQYVEGGVTYEKVFGSLNSLNSSSGPIILEPVTL